MAIRTSTQSGNTHSAPFAFGSAVNDGDQLVINHAVVQDANMVLGTSPPITPTAAATISATGGGSVGGSLAAGTYRHTYSYVDASGRECSPLREVGSTIAVSAGNIPRVTIGTLPAGVVSATLYLTTAGGGLGTSRKYCSGITGTTVDLVSGGWHNTYDGSGDATGGSTAFADADTQPNGFAAVVNSAGSLTVASGVSLTLRGDVQLIGALTFDSASSLEFDASLSETSEAEYGVWTGTAINQSSTAVAFNGTSGNRCSVSSNAGGGVGFFRSGIVFSGQGRFPITAAYTDFTRIGSATRSAMRLYNNAASSQQVIHHCVFDGCGILEIPVGLPSTSGWSIHSNTFKNSAATPTVNGTGTTVCMILANSTAAGAGVVRECYGNVFDRVASLSANNATYPAPGNYYHNGWETTTGGVTAGAVVHEGWFARITAERNTQSGSPHEKNGYFYWDDVSTGSTPHTNPHGFNAGGNDQTFEGLVFEANPSLGNGDCVKTFQGFDYTIKNCLVLPSGNGGTSGTLCTMFSNTPLACRLSIYHNTIWNATGTVVICEGGSQPVGTLENVKSNLYARPASPPTPGAQGGYKVALSSGSFTGISNDILSPGSATHNAILNGRTLRTDDTTPVTKSYSYPHTTDPGADDVDLGSGDHADLFVDPSRNFETWGEQVLGITGTREEIITGTLNALRAVNEPGDPNYHPSATIENLWTWVRAGFAPRNVLLQNAGHDGVTIGAIEGVFSATFNPAWAIGSNILIGV